MQFFRRAAGRPASLGIVPGTFNPPTRAHLALARAALSQVDEIVFVLPRAFPHKAYEGAGFEDRIRLLELAVADEPRFSIAATEQGLFIEIARECRSVYGASTRLLFVCGRDAAKRIVEWDYGAHGAIGEQLREYQLLVARRQGDYEPPQDLRDRILPLHLEAACDEISATAVRDRIRCGEPWENMVPPRTVELVRRIYSN